MRTGLGFEGGVRFTGVVHDRLWTLLQSIRLKASTPAMFDASSGYRVPKKAVSYEDDHTIGTDRRIVHAFPPLAKSYYAGVWKQVRAPSELDCSFGAVPGRRREAAACVQQVMRERLAKRKISSALNLLGVKSAFCPVSREVIDKDVEELRSVHNDPVHQRSSQAVIKHYVRSHRRTLQASDGPLWRQPGEGAPQGHSLRSC